MATGLEMYDALARAVAANENGAMAVNEFDAEDLMKLTADDLRARGVGNADAARVASALAEGRLSELGNLIGVDLTIDDSQANLIPSEGIRRSAGAFADDDQSLEEMFEELDRIRHPERYPV